MKTLLYLSLSLLIFVTVHAQDASTTPNVVLLTSLETPRIWYRPKGWKVDGRLEEIFKKHFTKSGYNIVVKHGVDFHELRKQLHNPNNIAVYWASHAAGTSNGTTGAGSAGAVLSINGKDVKDIFKSVHPNIRFLGLVGCDGQGILDEIARQGHYRYNPNLMTHSFTKKIDARRGLKKSLKASVNQLGYVKKRLIILRKKRLWRYDFYGNKDLLTVNNHFHCGKEDGFLIKGTRTLAQDSMSITVRNSTGLLKVLPAGKAGDVQEFQFYIPYHPDITRTDFKISVDSMIYFGKDQVYLGEFDFSSDWGLNWRVFAKPDGTVLGYTKNLYLPRGVLPTHVDLQTYKELSCNESEEMKVQVY